MNNIITTSDDPLQRVTEVLDIMETTGFLGTFTDLLFGERRKPEDFEKEFIRFSIAFAEVVKKNKEESNKKTRKKSTGIWARRKTRTLKPQY